MSDPEKRCAYQKAEDDRTGQIPCSLGTCAVTLFRGTEGTEPVNLSVFLSCGTPLHPAGTVEWSEVELHRTPVVLSDGRTFNRVASRQQLVPVQNTQV